MSADQKWGALVIAAAIALLVWGYRAAGRRVGHMIDDGLALFGDDDWADDTEAAIDEALALTVPLYGAETAQRIAAIIAYNEAQRADWTEPMRWAR